MNTKKIYVICFFVMIYIHIIATFMNLYSITSYMLLALGFVGCILLLKALQKINLSLFPINYLLLLMLIFFIVFITVYYNINYVEIFDIRNRGSISTLNSYALGIVSWLFFGIFASISFDAIKISDIKLLIMSLIILIIFIFFSRGGIGIDYNYYNSLREIHISHLTIGYFLIYLIIYIQSQIKSKLLLIFLINCMILFMVGGRSDLFVFVISSFLYYGLFFDQVRRLALPLVGFILLFFIAILMQFFIDFGSQFDRVIYIFKGVDESAIAREEFKIRNMQDLGNKIILGNPNYHIQNYNDFGVYIHNILSIWEYYGGVFFIYIVFIVCYLLFKIVKKKHEIVRDNLGRFLIYLFIFCSLSIVLSKPIFYYPFWFMLGFSLFYLSNKPRLRVSS